MDAKFPAKPGTYILLLKLETATSISIGALGTFDFPAGWYAYVGSAFGPGGLRGRLAHHLRPVRRPHWHIDYLRQAASVQHVVFKAGTELREHVWAAQLAALPGAWMPVPRFGASDCRCPAHLVGYRSEARPDPLAILG